MALGGFKRWMQEKRPDWVMILRLVRYEIGALRVRWMGCLSPWRRARLRRLQKSRGLKLNIASGPFRHEGWVNVDTASNADLRVDLRRKMPLTTSSAALVFCEHFADHLQFPHAIRLFLSECARVLEPGGRARFVLHDAEGLCRAYVSRDDRYFQLAEQVAPTRIESVNMLFRFNGFHQFLHDFESFERLLREAGFSRVIRCAYRQSEVPGLALDYVHETRDAMSMYIEAVR